MSKSSYLGANVEVTSDTFTSFINKVNEVIGDMGTTVLTAAPVAQANATNGGMTVGNAHVQGVLSANTMAAQEIGGGSMSVPADLVISTNANPKTADINFGQDGNRINRVFTVNSNSRNLFSNTANVVSATVNALTVNVATITTETVNALTANVAEVETGNVNSFTANVASIKSANVLVLTSNNATVNVATITTANVATLNAANANIESANANTVTATTLTSTGDTVVTGNLVVQGTTSLASNTAFSVNTSISQTLTVHQQALLNGNVVIGNTSSKTVSIGASLISDLVPSGNTRNLGNSTNRFANLYVNAIPGTTFTANTDIRMNFPTLRLIEADNSDKTWLVMVDGGEWSVRENDTGTTRLRIAANGSATGLSYLGQTVWTAGNDGAGSTLDADLLDGQQGTYYLDATNLTGTIPDARLPASMAGKTFTSEITGTTATFTGNEIEIQGTSPRIKLTDTTASSHDFWMYADGSTFYILRDTNDDGTWETPHALALNSAANTGQLFGQTIWTAGNDGSGSGLDAGLLEGQNAAFFRNGSNINAGTVADARLPTTMAGKQFNSAVSILSGTAATAGTYFQISPTDFASGKPGLFINRDSATVYRISTYDGVGNGGTINLNATNVQHNGNAIWSTGNFDPNTKLDKTGGTLTGNLFGTYIEASGNILTQAGNFYAQGSGNIHLWYRSAAGTPRAVAYYSTASENWNVQLYNSAGTNIRAMSYRQSDGQFYVNGFLEANGNLKLGSATYQADGNVYMPWAGDWLSNVLNSKITTEGRSYPRRIGGVDLNFNWSGQSGQPNWVWGGSDGSNMYVYNPSNFNVNYAGSSGNSDTVDGYHATDLCQLYKGTGNGELNYPLGHIILCFTSTLTYARNAALTPCIGSSNTDFFYQQGVTGAGSALTGTWRSSGNVSYSGEKFFMLRRTA